jgi:integrase
MTVAQLLEAYLRVGMQRRGWAPLTIKTYRGMISSHIAQDPLANIPIDEVRAFDLNLLVERLGSTPKRTGTGRLGPRRVAEIVKLVAEALRWAARQDLIARDPTMGLELPRRPRRRVALDEDVLADYLILSEGHWLHIPIACAALAGLRRGEIYSRRRSDIDLVTGFIRVDERDDDDPDGPWVPKTDAGIREVAMPRILAEILAAEFRRRDEGPQLALWPSDWLVAQPDGRPRSAHAFGMAYARFLATMPLPRVRLHDLRHTYASHLVAELRLAENRDATIRQMGHSVFATTWRGYVHPLRQHQARAADLFDQRIRAALERRRLFWQSQVVGN